jgi:hypothetical protein
MKTKDWNLTKELTTKEWTTSPIFDGGVKKVGNQ